MHSIIKYIVITIVSAVLVSCQSEENYSYLIQTKHGENMKKGTPIFYLGVEVGQIEDVNFGTVNNEDFVFVKFYTSTEGILKECSQLKWSKFDALEIINNCDGNQLAINDTVFMDLPKNSIIEKAINPIQTEKIDNTTTNNLTPEEKIKFDSLKNKIDKLNNLIKEVNDQN